MAVRDLPGFDGPHHMSDLDAVARLGRMGWVGEHEHMRGSSFYYVISAHGARVIAVAFVGTSGPTEWWFRKEESSTS